MRTKIAFAVILLSGGILTLPASAAGGLKHRQHHHMHHGHHMHHECIFHWMHQHGQMHQHHQHATKMKAAKTKGKARAKHH